MANIESSRPNINRSFLSLWVVANMFALPILWGPMKLGNAILLYLGRVSNGKPIGFVEFMLPLLLIPVGGALMGAWLGLLQWLVLRQQTSQIKKWVLVSCFGGLIGASLSWITYTVINTFLLAHSPKGSYPSEWFTFLAFGGVLGLSLGISQWIVLKRLGNKAAWWILILPACFTLSLWATYYQLIPNTVIARICQLTQSLTTPFQGPVINQLLTFSTLLRVVIVLAGMGWLTGIVLGRLLHLRNNQVEEG